ncbi:MAG: reverse transcriptase/maturase family protein [Sulfurimonadaceae bacterium]
MQASNYFKTLFTKISLLEIYSNNISYNVAVGVDRINKHSFESKLDAEIETINRKTMNNSYDFSFYKEKLISKGRTKYPRVISIPTIRDKVTLRALTNLLTATFQEKVLNELVHTTIHSIKTTIESSTYDSFIKIDIKDFYPSLDHDILLKRIRQKIRKKEIISLIEKAIKQETVSAPKKGLKKYTITKGVPQGLSISNILASIYMMNLDAKYKSKTTFDYYRYVDDILIICNNSDVDEILKSITKDTSKMMLEIHELKQGSEKTDAGLLKDGFYYLGYYYKDVFTVRDASIHRLENSIVNTFSQYKYAKIKNLNILLWKLNLKITGCKIEGKKYGWLFFFSQIEDIQLLFKLDRFVQQIFVKFGITRNVDVKSFVRTYHEILKNRSNTRYIPNFDSYTIDDKKDILVRIYGENIKWFDDEKINQKFNRIIYQSVKEMEQDIQKY